MSCFFPSDVDMQDKCHVRTHSKTIFIGLHLAKDCYAYLYKERTEKINYRLRAVAESAGRIVRVLTFYVHELASVPALVGTCMCLAMCNVPRVCMVCASVCTFIQVDWDWGL